MVGSEKNSQRWNVRNLIKIAVVVFLFGFTLVLALLLDEAGGGGHVVDSPDGKFSVGVQRHSSSWRTIPYTVTLVDLGSGELLRRVSIHPVQGKPNQDLPNSSNTIAWDEQNRFADIVLEGEYVCRIYVPSQPVTIQRMLPGSSAR